MLAPSEVAAPIRQLEVKQANLSVLLGEVVAVDPIHRTVDADCPGLGTRKIRFDFLIVATGMRPSYFGHHEYASYAPGLKTLADVDAIRTKILSAIETAAATDDEDERARQMAVVLVGGGPTGVELAASLTHIVSVTLRGNFRHIDSAMSTIILVEGGNRLLLSFTPSLSAKVAKRLSKLGVQVVTDAKVETVDAIGNFSPGGFARHPHF